MKCACEVGSDIGGRIFAQRVVGHLNRLPRKMVMTPCLTEFKEHLDNVVSHMV